MFVLNLNMKLSPEEMKYVTPGGAQLCNASTNAVCFDMKYIPHHTPFWGEAKLDSGVARSGDTITSLLLLALDHLNVLSHPPPPLACIVSIHTELAFLWMYMHDLETTSKEKQAQRVC